MRKHSENVGNKRWAYIGGEGVINKQGFYNWDFMVSNICWGDECQLLAPSQIVKLTSNRKGQRGLVVTCVVYIAE